MPSRLASSTTATTSSASRGVTTPTGFHLVNAGVGAVESAGEIVETDFAGDALFELGGEVSGEGGIGAGGEGHGIGVSEGLDYNQGIRTFD